MRSIAVVAALFTAAVLVHATEAARSPVELVSASYGRIVLLKGDGTAIAPVVQRGEAPAWSPDARRIAFVRDGDIWVVGESGRGLERVTRTAVVEEYPDWSPDGRLVYSAGGSLWTLRIGTKPKRLTHPRQSWEEDRAPQWSPDGRSIAFASTRGNYFDQELYLVRPDGTGLRRLTFTNGADSVPADDGLPAWRPDGSGLVFVSNRDRNLELYALDLKTLVTTRLTETPDVDESLPRIARDGRYAFVVQQGQGRARIATAKPGLIGLTVLQAGTGADWRP
jgi:Tol biopolymer transport system component